jgi:hypothetical protein
MNWSQVEIIDTRGRSIRGQKAREFVLKNGPKGLVIDYKEGRFALRGGGGGKITVNPEEIQAALEKALKAHVREVRVRVAPPQPRGPVVPRRGGGNRVDGNARNKELTIELKLGDIDALLSPIGGGDPWTEKGVRERLQVLGYLYTPLGHPHIENCTKSCWEYYSAIQIRKKGQALNKDTLIKLLRKEVQQNLVVNKFPESGEILGLNRQGEIETPAKLPTSGAFSAIRFPGGYACNKSPSTGRRVGDHFFNNSAVSLVLGKYDYELGGNRAKYEEIFFNDNELLGKIPLVVKVTEQTPEGEARPVEGAVVYIQLVDPDNIPDDSDFQGAELPERVMDYGKDWHLWEEGDMPNQVELHKRLTDHEWQGVHALTRKAFDENGNDPVLAKGQAETWIDEWAPDPPPIVPDEDEEDEDGGGPPPPPMDFGPQPKKRPPWEPRGAEVDPIRAEKVDEAKEVVEYLLKNAPPYELTGRGQRNFMTRVLQHCTGTAVAQDPQRSNAPAKYGGKAQHADGIRAVLDVSKAWEGFNTKRPDHQNIYAHDDYGALRRAALPLDSDPNKHAVKCVTNDKGYAGVLFMPSRCGGDRYKLKAFVDREWRRSNGVRDNVEIETGTLVVWRNVRIHRHIKLETPSPTGYSGKMTELLEYPKNHLPDHMAVGGGIPQCPSDNQKNWVAMHLDSCVRTASLLPGADPEPTHARRSRATLLQYKSSLGKDVYPMTYRPVDVSPSSFQTQLKRAYCELIPDTWVFGSSSDSPERLDFTEWQRAVGKGIEAITNSNVTTPKTVEWDKLIVHDPTSPFFFNYRSFAQYNALKSGLFPRLDGNTDSDLFTSIGGASNYMTEGAAEYLAKGGVVPGLTLIQIPRGSTWDGNALSHFPAITSGLATHSRCVYVSHTDEVYKRYMGYSVTSNMAHEFGHVFGFDHQHDDLTRHEDSEAEQYEKTPADNVTVCVMSYFGSYGDYCGGCLLGLRGWDAEEVIKDLRAAP